MKTPKTYVEHIALRVQDIQWHLHFFEQVLGMPLREVQGDPQAPTQCWTYGGIQLIHAPQATAAQGPLAHIGIMCEDLEATLALAGQHHIKATAQGPHWLELPDGVVVELIQAHPAEAVSHALTINPRTEA